MPQKSPVLETYTQTPSQTDTLPHLYTKLFIAELIVKQWRQPNVYQ